MQRRAAAAYATLFILLAAGAYLMIGVVQEPAVAIDDPDYTISEGDTVTINGREYSLTGDDPVADSATPTDRTGTLVWVNASEKQTATLDNDTEVTAASVSWPGQTARDVATFQNGSTVSYNGSEWTLLVGDGSFTLQSNDRSEEFSVGDTFRYRDNATTVVGANQSVTLAWGEPYNVRTRTATNDSFDFHQAFNVSARLMADPAVENETVTRSNGREYVVYRNGTTQLLDEYLPDSEVKTFDEGDTFTYNTAEDGIAFEDVTVENVTAERVLVSWRGPVEHEVTAENGGNVTLGSGEGTQFVAHFPDNETMELSTDVAGYQEQLAVRETFHDRVNGLWGVSILAGLAAAFLLAAAYLPSRY